MLLYEFKTDIAAYLATLGPGARPRTLDDLIRFNEENREREMPWFGQERFIASAAKGPLTDPAYVKALETSRRLARGEGIDAALERDRLDAIVAPTGGPAWTIDLVNGDHFGGGSSTHAAVAGYPNVTVPAGMVQGLPVGISFFAGAFAEGPLISIAYAYEQATLHRRAPTFRASVEGLAAWSLGSYHSSNHFAVADERRAREVYNPNTPGASIAMMASTVEPTSGGGGVSDAPDQATGGLHFHHREYRDQTKPGGHEHEDRAGDDCGDRSERVLDRVFAHREPDNGEDAHKRDHGGGRSVRRTIRSPTSSNIDPSVSPEGLRQNLQEVGERTPEPHPGDLGVGRRIRRGFERVVNPIRQPIRHADDAADEQVAADERVPPRPRAVDSTRSASAATPAGVRLERGVERPGDPKRP